MKNLLVILSGFFLLVISGCNMANFDRVPGQKLEVIPVGFQGKYFFIIRSEPSKNNDTIRLEIKEKMWTEIERGKIEEHPLNDSNVLSIYNNRLYFSTLSDEGPFWNTVILEKKDKNIMAYPLFLSHKYDDPIFNSYFMRKPVRKAAGDTTDVYMMYELNLEKYFDKEINKSKGIQLIRVE